MHLQPRQAKLVRCGRGASHNVVVDVRRSRRAIHDVVVDLRRGSHANPGVGSVWPEPGELLASDRDQEALAETEESLQYHYAL